MTNTSTPALPSNVEELLPCPFCGAEVRIIEDSETCYFHACCDESCGARGPQGDDKKQASILWNLRPISPQPPQAGRVDKASDHAPARAESVTQDGWKIVPVEPTPEMAAAGFVADDCAAPMDIYRAMLAKAPLPPQPDRNTGEVLGRLRDCEAALHRYDEGEVSEYWLRYPALTSSTQLKGR